MCELRLLAVDREYRRGSVLPLLFDRLWQHCLQQGFDLALISGIVRQLKLYRHLGFEPFGPLVGEPPAVFQPMMLTLERFAPRAGALFRRTRRPAS
jgi:GNAT superfamily N-acetyltransferase